MSTRVLSPGSEKSDAVPLSPDMLTGSMVTAASDPARPPSATPAPSSSPPPQPASARTLTAAPSAKVSLIESSLLLSSSACRRSDGGLVSTFRRLVLLERLRGVDVAERRMLRQHVVPAVELDRQALREHGEQRARLHVAHAGQGEQTPLQVGRIRCLRPHPLG